MVTLPWTWTAGWRRISPALEINLICFVQHSLIESDIFSKKWEFELTDTNTGTHLTWGVGGKLGEISNGAFVFILWCRAEDISMQQETRPSESHSENFKSTVFKTAQCGLIQDHKDRERERQEIRTGVIFSGTKVSQSVSLVNIIGQTERLIYKSRQRYLSWNTYCA